MPVLNETNRSRLFQLLVVSAKVFNPSHLIQSYIGNITAPNAELMAIRLGIAEATSPLQERPSTPHIHSGQGESIAIVHLLRPFFNRNSNNKVEFWDCLSKARWYLHAIVDDDAKSTIVPCTPVQFTSLDALRDKSSKIITFNHGHNKGH